MFIAMRFQTDSAGTEWSLFWIAFMLGINVKGLPGEVWKEMDRENRQKNLKSLWSVCPQSKCDCENVEKYEFVMFQDEIRGLVLRNEDTKHEFYEFVRSGWELPNSKDSNTAITYKSQEYRWSSPPVRGHDDVYSWKETLFWLSLVIDHQALGEYIWDAMDADWKFKNLLNVSYRLCAALLCVEGECTS